ncbi:MAG: acetate/propionate family kinase [Mucilaginibacter sp.]|jgi:acetate kinase|uniref:acetate/propionate family kinase n=1 Tax=Mucilaginibacter sp. TaxID=1882438 RepID=UPI0035697D17
MANFIENYTLCINCGSSSLKFSLYKAATCTLKLSGQVDRIGQENAALKIDDHAGRLLNSKTGHFPDFKASATEFINWLKTNNPHYNIQAIGHRLVQGGPKHRQPEIITPELLDDLQQYIYLAPNHLPDELNTIKTFGSAYPEATPVACFDTAFHRHMPDFAKNYPLPPQYLKKGLFKYGFHGLSYGFIMQQLAAQHLPIDEQKIIICHLGNGSSMAAVKKGISVDTTMGISPIGGLVMATRSGDLDPGVLLFLLKQYHMNPEELDDLLSKHSGLKAIAGNSDVQELLKAEPDDKSAETALKVFCYSAKKHIGSLAAALQGLDMLVFTGGIGENSATIRARICLGLDFMGIDLDGQKNAKNETIISKITSRVTVRVIKTNEELMMAMITRDLLNSLNKQ